MRRPHKLLLLILSFFLAFSQQKGFSQTTVYDQNYDSLVKLLPFKSTDGEKIKCLVQLIDLAPDVKSERQMQFLKQLIELNKKSPNIDGRPYELMYEGHLQWSKNHYDSALSSFKATIELFDQKKKAIIPLLMEMRLFYNSFNKQDEKFQFYKEKLDYYLLNGPIDNAAACYHGIAGYYVYKADHNLAINNYFKAAAIFKTFSRALYYNEFGAVGAQYAIWGNDEKAVYYMNMVIPLEKRALIQYSENLGVNISFQLITLIRISSRKGKYDQALAYSNEALQYANKHDNDPIYAVIILEKALLYIATKRPDSAYFNLMQAASLNDSFHFHQQSTRGSFEIDFGFYQYYRHLNKSKAAVSYLLAAYNKSVTEQENELQLKYLRELAAFYNKQNPALSMQYVGKYFGLSDSIEKGNVKIKIAQYENEEKETEQNQRINILMRDRAVQEEKISQRNTIVGISLSALALIVLSMFFLYRQFNINRKTLQSLRNTQQQLIMSEKMASLGELTAGIAHEIQNPLNFVNNFSEVNKELLVELSEEINKGNLDEAKVIARNLIENEEKISHHGKRADTIVKGMLEHSRASTGKKELADLNVLTSEYLKLSYHAFRVRENAIAVTMLTDYDKSIGKINVVQQDLGRVLLNIFNNALYAVAEKKKSHPEGYEPTVSVATKRSGNQVELRVMDNGNGIPQKILDKIFQPFFTTKPAGQGTGLGLSMSYDIIKAFGGEMKVKSEEGKYAEFIVHLPL